MSRLSLLEIAILDEHEHTKVHRVELIEAVAADPRFVIGEIPLNTLVEHGYDLAWTRDPIDRLLAAHSAARRVPLLSLDRTILHHPPLHSRRAAIVPLNPAAFVLVLGP